MLSTWFPKKQWTSITGQSEDEAATYAKYDQQCILLWLFHYFQVATSPLNQATEANRNGNVHATLVIPPQCSQEGMSGRYPARVAVPGLERAPRHHPGEEVGRPVWVARHDPRAKRELVHCLRDLGILKVIFVRRISSLGTPPAIGASPVSREQRHLLDLGGVGKERLDVRLVHPLLLAGDDDGVGRRQGRPYRLAGRGEVRQEQVSLTVVRFLPAVAEIVRGDVPAVHQRQALSDLPVAARSDERAPGVVGAGSQGELGGDQLNLHGRRACKDDVKAMDGAVHEEKEEGDRNFNHRPAFLPIINWSSEGPCTRGTLAFPSLPP
ncbi:hypothetical protein THAOC_30859 [Thalassiosira oceanica]|uniref:Uncharacterized protein n=1 Tax=Thalassiosira oceanica TaxID=159749 RepID=K0RD98_THAOC|nr:hypothetical protein THAOC_30859 [Thalassiosira oceanica]|eukprot:EJK50199.1 hypothetical protein THAOC_30859 [Thalassiosira oceanica]